MNDAFVKHLGGNHYEITMFDNGRFGRQVIELSDAHTLLTVQTCVSIFKQFLRSPGPERLL
ncbi:hypothetical protein AWC11_03345 [Mycobacterium interjectum]|nr:hypothetical protein AWC11_03345 [Mycobacterium interjectum]